MLHYKPEQYYCIVKWELSQEGLVKCDTNDSHKENSGISACDSYLRSSLGDLIYVEVDNVSITTNVEAIMRLF